MAIQRRWLLFFIALRLVHGAWIRIRKLIRMLTPDDPNNLLGLSPLGQGVILAFILSILRGVYDRKERKWQRIGLEGAICAALTYAAHSVLSYAALPDSLIVFVGGFVGYVGATQIREWILKLVGGRVDK